MKYIWEEVDIECGRRIQVAHNVSNGERIIGYRYDKKTGQKMYTIISLCDGLMIIEIDSKQELADFLNSGKFRPLDIRKDI